MTQAELHGKIGSRGTNLSESLEDLLTSDVFGPLRYLPSSEAVIPILNRSRLYSNPMKRLNLVPCANSEGEFVFWPRLAHCEPDILIRFSNAQVLVEAKYLSGKSGEGGTEDQDSQSAASVPRDQLAREFLDLLSEQVNSQDIALIYVTAHNVMPVEDFTNGLEAISEIHQRSAFQSGCYWLSWFDVHAEICNLLVGQADPYRRQVLNDIRRLLYRKGFRQFEGFPRADLAGVPVVPNPIFYS